MKQRFVPSVLAIAIACPFCAAMLLAKSPSAPTSTQASAAATTKPSVAATTTPPSTSANFPTPAELIARMRSMKKQKEALPHIAYFDLDDALAEKPADFSFFGDPDETTLKTLLDRVRAAKNDKEIRGVLITLGANADLKLSQAIELASALAEVNKAGKQTFVYADSFDTGSYIAASGANHVCMLEGGEIMMPGVGMEAMFAKGLLDKIGVKADYIQIGEYKGADEEYTRTSASDQLRGEMTKLADQLYEQIVSTISLNRNLSTADVKAIIDDAMISGQAAKERGLVDHLVDQDGLRDLIAGEVSGAGKGKDKIELVYNYGVPGHEAPDLSNPFALLATLSKRPEPSTKPQVALCYVDGVITDGRGGQGMFGGSSVGSDEMRKALRTALRDDKVKSLVIRIDSPGGSAMASEVIWQAARRVAENKPVIISVGSIGVVGGKFVWKDLYEKLGVATESFTKGRNADLFSSSTPFSDRQRKLITQWMKQTYDQFTDRILTTRKDKIAHIDDVARGRIFSAKAGKDLGLVDEIGGLQSALTYAAKQGGLKEGDYDVRILPQPRTLADIFLGGNPEAAAQQMQPKTRAAGGAMLEALFGVLDGKTRAMLSQQLEALTLFRDHPVVLVSPVMVSVR